MSFYLPRQDIMRVYLDLNKNGIDVILLTGSLADDGVVKNTNPCQLGKMVNMAYNQVANGLDYCINAGIIKCEADNIIFPGMKKMFMRGQGGYFALHDIFASEQFIKTVNEVPKRLSLVFLTTGIGFKGHKKAYAGMCFKEETLMSRAGVTRPCRLKEALKELEPYFITIFDEEKRKYHIRVRPEFLAEIRVYNNYPASLSSLFYILKQNNYFIKSWDVLKDLLCLLKRYGPERMSFALQQARYTWQKLGHKLPAYLNTVILESLACGKVKICTG